MKTTRGYWSDTFRNKYGENLQTCLDKYGYGVDRDAQRALKVTVIYLDETKEFEYSWLVRIDIRNTFRRAAQYENDSCVRIKVINLP